MKRFMAFCLALALVICFIPMPQADAANMTATVKGGWLRLREQPNTNAKTINSYYTGTQVTILGTSGSWYYVRVNGNTGYMMGSYLTINADSGSSNAPSGNLNITAYVTSANGLSVRMRSGPSTTYSVVGSYPVGTKATILAKGTYWFQVSINGQIGYMMSQYLTTSGTGATGGTTTTPPSTGTGYTAYVYAANGKNVNLRTGAGTNYAVMGSYSVGTQVTVLNAGATWSYIRVGTRTGYMMSEFLRTTGGTTGGTTSTPSTGSYTAYVTSTNGYGVRMRTGAGTTYRVIATLPVGTQVTVLQHNATWDYIRFGTTDGYMQNSFLTTILPDGSTGDAPATGYYATVYTAANTYPVKMRKGAGTNYDVIASIPQGVRVTVLSESGDWCYISYNGTTGYMMKSFLVKDTTTTDVTAVVLNIQDAHPGDTLSATITPSGATVTYSWVDKDGNVLGSDATYTVKETDIGKQIAVRVTGTGSYTGNVISPYATVTTASKTALSNVTISGDIKVGGKLTAKVTPEGATASYKWYRGEGILVGESSEYTITKDDVGFTLYCVATGMGSYSGEVKSDKTVVVPGDKIALTGVSITGTAKCGSTLTAVLTPSGATADITWYNAKGEKIGEGATYTLEASDWETTVYCQAVGKGDYTGTVKSEPTASVATNTDLLD